MPLRDIMPLKFVGRRNSRAACAFLLFVGSLPAFCTPAFSQPASPSPSHGPQSQSQRQTSPAPSQGEKPASPQSEKPPHPSTLPRGKKLLLKDGGSEIVRSYSVENDRVRYYSMERSQWEEIPVSMVDWDATHREETAEAAAQSAQLASVQAHERELAARTVTEDVDASYEVAPGVFMPAGDGLFLLQGSALTPLSQATADLKTDKRRAVEKMLAPMPGLVPSRRNLELKGAHAALRLRDPQPEFYLHTSEQREPRVELLQARVRGDSRVFESLDTTPDVGPSQPSTVSKSIPMQSWTTAKGLYRFTLAQPLPPGEYVVTMLPDGSDEINLMVWEFGLDAPANAASHAP
jgi:hypothetical protein